MNLICVNINISDMTFLRQTVEFRRFFPSILIF